MMADEILHANIIRVTKDGPRWCALIGPDPQRGLVAFGSTPALALERLALECDIRGWVFDETWKP